MADTEYPEEMVKLLNTVLAEQWTDMYGLDEHTMYGELAMDVAMAAIREERAACQRIALEYGGKDAEEIAEQIGKRNFSQ